MILHRRAAQNIVPMTHTVHQVARPIAYVGTDALLTLK